MLSSKNHLSQRRGERGENHFLLISLFSDRLRSVASPLEFGLAGLDEVVVDAAPEEGFTRGAVRVAFGAESLAAVEVKAAADLRFVEGEQGQHDFVRQALGPGELDEEVFVQFRGFRLLKKRVLQFRAAGIGDGIDLLGGQAGLALFFKGHLPGLLKLKQDLVDLVVVARPVEDIRVGDDAFEVVARTGFAAEQSEDGGVEVHFIPLDMLCCTYVINNILME